MPNLKQIDLEIWPEGLDSVISFDFPPRGEVQLPKLKHLQIQYEDEPECQFIDLLEFILLNTEAEALKSLKIVRLNEVEESEFNRMAQIICASKVEKLSLEDISYGLDHFPIWNILMDQLSSRLDELEIYMELSGDEIRNSGSFDLLERFLAKCTGLRTLILVNFDVSGEGPIPTSSLVQFPTLSHLENLKIEFELDHLNMQSISLTLGEDTKFPIFSFNILNLTNFPKLKNVYWEAPRISRPLTFDIRNLFDPSDNQFNSVKSLDIGNYRGEGKLSAIFPNLMKISAIVDDCKYLYQIFEGMPNLIEVDLTLCSNMDNNGLLRDASRFIGPLKKLLKLTVRNFERPYPKVRGEGGDLGIIGLKELILLNPLNVIIHNANVKETDDIVAFLRTRHTQLQLLEE